MSQLPKISIIIPLWIDIPRFHRDLKKFGRLDYPNYEIIVVSDRKIKIKDPKIRVLLTRKIRTGPAEKRDLAISKARGEICAFIDDDAYPDKKWLRNAMVHFKHPNIAAVGGPGLTPKIDGYWEQLTGLVYSSFFCGGHAQYRFVKKSMRFVDDYPAYNLLVRKSVLEEVGGYGSHFYGGEDTFLCLKIIKKKYKILYDPEVVVYHHRRALFIPYLKQIANIGRHRGYFAKKFPETSLRPMYFLPTFLTVGFVVLPFLNLHVDVAVFGVSLLLGMLSISKKTGLVSSFLVSIGIISTHLVYGFNFIVGLATVDLDK